MFHVSADRISSSFASVLGALMIMAEMDERFELTITEEQFEAMTHPSDMIDLLRANNLLAEG